MSEKFKMFEKYMENRRPFGHQWDMGELFGIWNDGWNKAIEMKENITEVMLKTKE